MWRVALLLGDIAGGIRGVHDLLERVALAGDLDDADADADAEDAVFPDETVLGDRAQDVVRDLARLVERAADQQHAELVAAEARDRVRVAHRLADQRGDLAQHVVAREVAAGVVDGLEAVEVQVAHHVALAAGARDLERLAEAALELAAVDEAGERVVARLVGHLLRQAAQLAHVVQHHRDAVDVAGGPADRRGRCLHAELVAGRARDEDRAAAEVHAVAGGEALLHGIRDRATVVLVDEADHRAEGLADRLLAAHAGQRLRGLVQVFDDAVRVGRHDALAERVERQLGTCGRRARTARRRGAAASPRR